MRVKIILIFLLLFNFSYTLHAKNSLTECTESVGVETLMATYNQLVLEEIAKGASYAEAAKKVLDSDYYQTVFLPVSESMAFSCLKYIRSATKNRHSKSKDGVQ